MATFAAYKKYFKNSIIGIINLDAHFDIRSTKNGMNSGTAFYQIAEESKSAGRPFHYLCLGVQKQSAETSAQ